MISNALKDAGMSQTDAAKKGFLSRALINKIVQDKYVYEGKKIPKRIYKGIENTFGMYLTQKGKDNFEWGEKN